MASSPEQVVEQVLGRYRAGHPGDGLPLAIVLALRAEGFLVEPEYKAAVREYMEIMRDGYALAEEIVADFRQERHELEPEARPRGGPDGRGGAGVSS
jgi:hypothetical protein